MRRLSVEFPNLVLPNTRATRPSGLKAAHVPLVSLLAAMGLLTLPVCSPDDSEGDRDPCLSFLCGEHAHCEEQDAGPVCVCEQGYVPFDGQNCIGPECEPECDRLGRRECVSERQSRSCQLVEDCPAWVATTCAEGTTCSAGRCNPARFVSCEPAEQPGEAVAEPQLVMNLSIGNTGWFSSPAVVDLDGDDHPEIVAAFYDVAVFDSTGTLLSRTDHETYHRGRVYSPLVAADLEDDGTFEVVVAAGQGTVAAYEWIDGGLHIKDGWPASTCRNDQCPENRSLAAADLDSDGSIEVVTASTQTAGEGHLFVFTPDGSLFQPPGISWPAWPRYNTLSGEGGDADAYCSGHHGYGCYGENLGIGDLDDDLDLEIVATYDNHHIQVFNPDGIAFMADPTAFTHRGGDCADEPLSWGQMIRWIDPQVDADHWQHHTGDWPHPSWTMWAQWTQSPPTVADIDGDGFNEVVGLPNAEMDEPYHTYHHALFVLQGDYQDTGRQSARRLPGWEVPVLSSEPLFNDDWYPPSSIPAPVVVDVTASPGPEILWPDPDGHLYAAGGTAELLWRFDYAQGAALMGASEPAVADLDGDGEAEIVSTTFGENVGDGYLFILDSAGHQLHRIQLPDQRESGNGVGALAGPTIADIEGDGQLEILVLTIDHGLDIYTVPGSSPNCLLWPTARANYLRNGQGPHHVPPE